MIKDDFNKKNLNLSNSLAYIGQTKLRKLIAPSEIYKNYFNCDLVEKMKEYKRDRFL